MSRYKKRFGEESQVESVVSTRFGSSVQASASVLRSCAFLASELDSSVPSNAPAREDSRNDSRFSCSRVEREVQNAQRVIQSLLCSFKEASDNPELPTESPLELELSECVTQESQQSDICEDSVKEVVRHHFSREFASDERGPLEVCSLKNNEVTEQEYESEEERTWETLQSYRSKQDWGELSQKAGTASDFASKFWWIYAQSKLNSLSPVLLSLPLQEVLESLHEHKGGWVRGRELRREVDTLSREVLRSLFSAKEGNLEAFGLLTRLEQLEFNNETEWSELKRILEEKEPYLRTEAEKLILDEITEEAGSREEKVVLFDVPNIEKPDSTSEPLRLHDQRIVRSLSVVIAFIVFSLLGGATYIFWADLSSEEPEGAIHHLTLSSIPSLDSYPLILPQLPTRDLGVLDGLLLDTQRGGDNLVRTESVAESVSRNVSRTDVAGKAQIDLDGPIEPESVRQIILRARENVDRVEERVVDENYVKEVALHLGSHDERTAQTRGPMQYEVIVSTPVLAEPRFESSVLQELPRGRMIEVHERIGRWLRISSQKGRVGYVFVQDTARSTQKVK